MNLKINIVLAILIISITGRAQYIHHNNKYYGGASAEFTGQADIFSVHIPNGTTLKSASIVVYHPILYSSSGQNIQNITYEEVYNTSNSFSENIVTDTYGNVYTEYTLTSDEESDFIIQNYFTGETEVVLTTGFYSSHSFPTNLSSEYTMATTNIQSDDPDIKSMAQSLTNGCNTMQDAVEKIAEWVEGYIDYVASTNNNQDMDASKVFDRKAGNCQGFSNLIVALLRSVDIPSRVNGGLSLVYPFNMPELGGYRSWGTGLVQAHAVYEVYYPDKGWVIADPQRTLHFVSTHFVRFTNFQEPGYGSLATLSNVTFIGDYPPETTIGGLSATITDFENYYEYNSYSNYTSKNSRGYLYTAEEGFSTGINDEVNIVSSPNQFKTGENLFFSADFTSGDGTTYPVNWDWNIKLHHTNGTYTLCHEYNGNSFWSITTTPLLPSYNWLLDSNNNIYGEVTVTVGINDGDVKTNSLPLSVVECNGSNIYNQYFTSNSTQQSCYFTLENVYISNNAKLTLDTEMGITIEGNFNVALGSEFETQ